MRWSMSLFYYKINFRKSLLTRSFLSTRSFVDQESNIKFCDSWNKPLFLGMSLLKSFSAHAQRWDLKLWWLSWLRIIIYPSLKPFVTTEHKLYNHKLTALWALDAEVPGPIPSKTNLWNELFKLVLANQANWCGYEINNIQYKITKFVDSEIQSFDT